MMKVKSNLSGKYFGTLCKEDIKRSADINSNRKGYISLNDFMSRWQSSMNKPVRDVDRNVGEVVYDAFR